MYAQATTGTKANNNKFSQCSQNSMSTVMTALVNGNRFCFKGKQYCLFVFIYNHKIVLVSP
jgi:hypothetical protein